MSRPSNDPPEPEGFDERELIDAEFESMVEGLSLDESTPSTYLDELEAMDHNNRFIPPTLPKSNFKLSIKGAKAAFQKWRHGDTPDGDGAVI